MLKGGKVRLGFRLEIMGCMCSKGVSTRNKLPEKHGKLKEKESKKHSSKRSVASYRKDDVGVGVDSGTNEVTTRLISMESAEKSAGSTPPARWDEGEQKLAVPEKPVVVPRVQIGPAIDAAGSAGARVQPQLNSVFSVRNGVDGAQVVAGWPSWLTDVAGEAIRGWIPRKADSFEKLEKIGQGTYSSVYRGRDLENKKLVALKKVRFANMDPESVRFMAREIIILRRLDHPNVMKLEGLMTSRVSGHLYLIFEYMEHDLAGLVASPTVRFTESQIKYYMQQLFRGLEHCHSRGVLHRDIKGANLLIDNNGNLKIADFGLATFVRTSQPLTSRVVTLWYRPPELLLGATDYGVAVDLWSSGCIIAELFAGKPIMPGRTEVEQLHKIFKLCGSPSDEYWTKSKLPHATIFKPQHPYKRCFAETFKDFPPSALSILDSLLAFEPECRGSATSALQSEFFTTQPLPSDPSCLPKYPPSKEFDIKMREEEARKQKGGVNRETKVSKAVPAPDANAELQASIQKWRGHSNAKSISEQFDPAENGGSVYPGVASRGAVYNGHLAVNGGWNEVSSSGYGPELRAQRSFQPLGAAAELSRFSNSMAAASGSSRFDLIRDGCSQSHWPEKQFGTRYNSMNDAESSHSLLGIPNHSFKKDQQPPKKEHAMGFGTKNPRMHYSGPLFPPGGSIEEILKDHEKQIQHAVRKAHHLNNAKMKKAYHNDHGGQTTSLLQYVGTGR
ncbi:probable serine/threonine-protein kinase At1g09600 [Ipomoea triloba]|uniref:probable serine/threonine-protein kinase At1g09600 n=1 Tax=Ipomoea triloba TaxID=35885 RepID=UPI00125CE4AA|nr:probable serine/threonine-protein kinase At1g09600 [Ipomoea triloba]